MRWSVGDKIMAKWPGSSLYFHAEIKSIDEQKDTAEVLYSDGTEMEIPASYIKSEASFHQKQSKSPARSRPKSRSPSRRSHSSSPARRGRALKIKDDDVNNQQSRSSSRGRKNITSSTFSADEKTVSSNVTEDRIVTTTTKQVFTVTKTKVDVSDTPIVDSRYMMTRQKAAATIRSPAAQIDTYIKKSEVFEHEYGGVLGSFFLYTTTPFLPITILLACSKADCSITKLHSSHIPNHWQSYFTAKSFAIVLGFCLFHAIIYALPFGYIIKGPVTPKGNRLNYRISARYTLFLTAAAYGAMVYYKVPLSSLHDQLFELAIAATVVSLAGNFLFYIKSFYVAKADLNPAALTGSHIYDSYMGRELHPRIGQLFDVKLYLYRVSMAAWLVVVWIEMGREYQLNGGKHSTQFMLVAVSQVLYVIFEFFYDEEQCPYMFDIKNEGLGFVQWFGEMAIVPFVYTFPVIYLVDHQTNLPLLHLMAAAFLEGLGLFLIISSGRQKILFRRNPYDWKATGYESLPPSREDGDRLLVSGLWGFVRHPNYLGEIFVAFGWSLACGFQHFVAWIYPGFLTVLICHRALRVDSRSRKKHGHAWNVYCQRVKYRVIPGLF